MAIVIPMRRMFPEHHHRTVFPYLIVALTLVLAIVVFALYEPGQRNRFLSFGRSQVTERTYQRDAGEILRPFDARGKLAEASAAQADVANAAANDLLNVRVPALYQKVHLELVVNFHQMAKVATTLEDPTPAFEELQAIRAQYQWMQE